MKLNASDIKNLNLMKHYRIIRKWACKNNDLNDSDLELLIYLDCIDLFTKNDSTLQVLYLELSEVNGKLWDLENKVREKKIRDKDFILASKKIFKLNQTRNKLKNDINIITGSDYRDVKEYEL